MGREEARRAMAAVSTINFVVSTNFFVGSSVNRRAGASLSTVAFGEGGSRRVVAQA